MFRSDFSIGEFVQPSVTVARAKRLCQKIGFEKFKAAAVAAVAAVSTNVSAADYTALTTAVDFADVITAMVAIAGATALAYVAWKGIGMILGAIKR